MIADYSDGPTLEALRLVCHAWSRIAQAPLFRTIRLRAGTLEDLKRHRARKEQISAAAQFCIELHLNMLFRSHSIALPRDLDILSSKLGDKVTTLVFDSVRWFSDTVETHGGELKLISGHPVESTKLSRLFPNIKSFRMYYVSSYPLTPRPS
jgi:hypothetical protein